MFQEPFESSHFVPIKHWDGRRSLTESLAIHDAKTGSDWTGCLSGAERITVTTYQIRGEVI